MATKLKLEANPSFKWKVPVPVAGGTAVDVEMTFKHRTKSELDAWIKSRSEKADAESFMEMVTAWELEDPFTKESVTLFLEIYGGAAVATYRTYVNELLGARVKN
jgi:hypothetical protein